MFQWIFGKETNEISHCLVCFSIDVIPSSENCVVDQNETRLPGSHECSALSSMHTTHFCNCRHIQRMYVHNRANNYSADEVQPMIASMNCNSEGSSIISAIAMMINFWETIAQIKLDKRVSKSGNCLQVHTSSVKLCSSFIIYSVNTIVSTKETIAGMKTTTEFDYRWQQGSFLHYQQINKCTM